MFRRVQKIALITLYLLQAVFMFRAAAEGFYKIAIAPSAEGTKRAAAGIGLWFVRALVIDGSRHDGNPILAAADHLSAVHLLSPHQEEDAEHGPGQKGWFPRRRRLPAFHRLANLAAAIRRFLPPLPRPPRPVFFHEKIPA